MDVALMCLNRSKPSPWIVGNLNCLDDDRFIFWATAGSFTCSASGRSAGLGDGVALASWAPTSLAHAFIQAFVLGLQLGLALQMLGFRLGFAFLGLLSGLLCYLDLLLGLHFLCVNTIL